MIARFVLYGQKQLGIAEVENSLWMLPNTIIASDVTCFELTLTRLYRVVFVHITQSMLYDSV